MPHVEIFTDGACSGNPGPGGWAYLIRDDAGREIEGSGGAPQTTNNKMEMLAAIEAMESLDGPHDVDLYSDSQYVVNGLKTWLDGWKRKGWKRAGNQPVKNVDLWKRLDALRSHHNLTPIWVRGHNDHAENERVDRLAVEAAARYA